MLYVEFRLRGEEESFAKLWTEKPLPRTDDIVVFNSPINLWGSVHSVKWIYSTPMGALNENPKDLRDESTTVIVTVIKG